MEVPGWCWLQLCWGWLLVPEAKGSHRANWVWEECKRNACETKAVSLTRGPHSCLHLPLNPLLPSLPFGLRETQKKNWACAKRESAAPPKWKAGSSSQCSECGLLQRAGRRVRNENGSETGPQDHCPAPPGRWKNFLLPLPFKCNSVCPSPQHPPSSLAGSSADIQPSWEKAGSFSLVPAWLKSPEEDWIFLPLCLHCPESLPTQQDAPRWDGMSTGSGCGGQFGWSGSVLWRTLLMEGHSHLFLAMPPPLLSAELSFPSSSG